MPLSPGWYQKHSSLILFKKNKKKNKTDLFKSFSGSQGFHCRGLTWWPDFSYEPLDKHWFPFSVIPSVIDSINILFLRTSVGPLSVFHWQTGSGFVEPTINLWRDFILLVFSGGGIFIAKTIHEMAKKLQLVSTFFLVWPSIKALWSKNHDHTHSSLPHTQTHTYTAIVYQQRQSSIMPPAH